MAVGRWATLGAALFCLLNLTTGVVPGGLIGIACGATLGAVVSGLIISLHSKRPYFAIAFVLVVALGGYAALHHAQPKSVAEARQEAVRRYPQLGVPNSPLNREFVARYNRYQATNRDYFKKAEWPLTLAAESQAAIDQAPRGN
ncbi:MAG: hypothetical protein P4L99_03345 [Chthoniobacter sp.]|nr:hypothetical protein [Chthoniobacter sp.]